MIIFSLNPVLQFTVPGIISALINKAWVKCAICRFPPKSFELVRNLSEHHFPLYEYRSPETESGRLGPQVKGRQEVPSSINPIFMGPWGLE